MGSPVADGWADRDVVLVEHHVRQPLVAFEREPALVVDSRLLFPSLKPAIPKGGAVVDVGPAAMLLSEVLLAGRQSHPCKEQLGGNFGEGCPLDGVVDHFVSGVRGILASLAASAGLAR